VNFTAHVVGFDVSEAEALRQMQCIADETGGRFLTARDAGELQAALSEVSAVEPVPEPEPEPEPLPEMVITGPQSAPAGSVQTYRFSAPTGPDDFLSVYDAQGEQVYYRTTRSMDALEMQLPTTPGAYELRYEQRGREDAVLGRLALDLSEMVPAPMPPAGLTAGATVEIGWAGPAAEWDFLSIGDVDGGGGYHTASDYLVTGGNPISIALPATPGTYELRYVYGDQREHLVTQVIEVQ
jgi:Ca-activated chloride channel family protein